MVVSFHFELAWSWSGLVWPFESQLEAGRKSFQDCLETLEEHGRTPWKIVNDDLTHLDVGFIWRQGEALKMQLTPHGSHGVKICDSAWVSIPYLYVKASHKLAG